VEENNPVKDIIAALGSMCEISGIIFDGLQKNGFTREEAFFIVKDWLLGVCDGGFFTK
jgi:hypothetical protein